MPTFKFGDDVYTITSLPSKLAYEAEVALKMDPMASTFGRLSVQLFVAMRQAHPEMPAGVIADKVGQADWLKLEVEDDEEPESPLDADANGSGSKDPALEEPTDQVITGLPPSEVSA